jgi:hypothetical protein
MPKHRHGRACPGHPRPSSSAYDRWLCLYSGARTERRLVRGSYERPRPKDLRTSEWPDRRIYEEVFRQMPCLLRTSRRNSSCDPTRTQHQASVAKMESKVDTGRQSGLGRSVRFDHLRAWMAGTSPAMTDYQRTLPLLTQNIAPICRDRLWSASRGQRPACARRSGAWSGRPSRIRSPDNSSR